MEEKLFYCKKTDCPVTDCIHRPQNMRKLDVKTLVKCDIKHLEDNPLYCKKANWYGYQLTPEQVEKLKKEKENDQN